MKGPIQLIAASRKRLVAAVLLGLPPMLGVAVAVSGYVRETSNSPSEDLMLITAWMVAALGVSYVAAILLGDLLFPAGWRRINILGARFDVSKDDDLELAGAATLNQALPFALIVVGVVIAFVTITHFATGGFLPWYAKYGYASSTLRGDDTERKVAILKQMTRAQDGRLIQYSQMMSAQLDADNQAVRVQAMWSLGEVARRMVRSIELMNQGHKGGQWVFELYRDLKSTVQPRFLAQFKTLSGGAEGPALAYFLGAIQSKEALSVFKEYLSRSDLDAEMTVTILQALAHARDQAQGVPMIRPLFTDSNTEVAIAALWAVGEIYGFGTGDADEDPVDPKVIEILREHMPTMDFERQCVALETAQRLRDASLTDTLFKLFEDVKPVDRRCKRREMERPFQSPLAIVTTEEFREKIIKTLATIAQGNSPVLSWLEKHKNEPAIASGLRDDMKHILKVVRERPGKRY